MQVELLLDPNEETYAETRRTVITQRLSTALLLLLQELHNVDLKREMVIGKGISPVASVEVYDTHEKLRRAHEAAFGTEDERREAVALIQAATRQNSMVPEKR